MNLDSIVHQYYLGATAEQITYNFPPKSLADIHLAIEYFLTHREEVKAYLRQYKTDTVALQKCSESDPQS